MVVKVSTSRVMTGVSVTVMEEAGSVRVAIISSVVIVSTFRVIIWTEVTVEAAGVRVTETR
jgi:hypothetical protein